MNLNLMDRTSRGDVMSVDEDSLEEKERAEVETTLDRLRCGARGQVTTYHQGFDPQRYLEMGLTPGTEVEVVRYAPLGDPLRSNRGITFPSRLHAWPSSKTISNS